MVMKIQVEISGCRDCLHLMKTNQWSSDGWDRMEDWVCGRSGIKIRGCVEWHEESKIEIPEWCPVAVGTEWRLVADGLPDKGVDIIGVDLDGGKHSCLRCNCYVEDCKEWRDVITGAAMMIDVVAYRIDVNDH